jgi:hypothetical protein
MRGPGNPKAITQAAAAINRSAGLVGKWLAETRHSAEILPQVEQHWSVVSIMVWTSARQWSHDFIRPKNEPGPVAATRAE